MRNLVSMICFAIVCAFTTGCGGGGGNGIKGGDPPPSKSITLHGNVTITKDIANPVVTLYSYPPYRTAGSGKIVAQFKLANTKGIHPYQLVIPAGQPFEMLYWIGLYDFQSGGSVVDLKKDVQWGSYWDTILHLDTNINLGGKTDTWCTVSDEPGPKPWNLSQLSYASMDITKQSIDFSDNISH